MDDMLKRLGGEFLPGGPIAEKPSDSKEAAEMADGGAKEKGEKESAEPATATSHTSLVDVVAAATSLKAAEGKTIETDYPSVVPPATDAAVSQAAANFLTNTRKNSLKGVPCKAMNCDATPVKIGYCAHHALISSIRNPDDFCVTFIKPEADQTKDMKIYGSLQKIWTEFSGKLRTMDKGRWEGCIERLGLIKKGKLRLLDADLTFNVMKPMKSRTLQFEHFCRGLNLLAHKLYPEMEDVPPLRKLVAKDLKLKNL